MSFVLDLSGVNPNYEPVAASEGYGFRILGAKVENERLTVNVQIASEGDYKGRKLRFNYPDPDSDAGRKLSVPKLLKRLEQAIGVDQLPGEPMDVFFNRAAGQGATFMTAVTIREYEKDGVQVPTENVNIFAPKPWVPAN